MSIGFYSKVIYQLRVRSRVTHNACNTRKQESEQRLTPGFQVHITGSYGEVGTLFVPKTVGMHTFFYELQDVSTKNLVFTYFGVQVHIYGSHSRVGTLFVPKTIGMHTFFYGRLHKMSVLTRIQYVYISSFRYTKVYPTNFYIRYQQGITDTMTNVPRQLNSRAVLNSALSGTQLNWRNSTQNRTT